MSSLAFHIVDNVAGVILNFSATFFFFTPGLFSISLIISIFLAKVMALRLLLTSILKDSSGTRVKQRHVAALTLYLKYLLPFSRVDI